MQLNMSFIRHSVLALSVILWSSFLVPSPRAQTTPVESAHGTDIGWQWVEQFAGSANTDGQVMALTSSGGYNFSSHLGLIAGLPAYFVHNSSYAGPSPARDPRSASAAASPGVVARAGSGQSPR